MKKKKNKVRKGFSSPAKTISAPMKKLAEKLFFLSAAEQVFFSFEKVDLSKTGVKGNASAPNQFENLKFV